MRSGTGQGQAVKLYHALPLPRGGVLIPFNTLRQTAPQMIAGIHTTAPPVAAGIFLLFVDRYASISGVIPIGGNDSAKMLFYILVYKFSGFGQQQIRLMERCRITDTNGSHACCMDGLDTCRRILDADAVLRR